MLTPIKSDKVYEIIMKQIKELVKSGEFKCGDKLPSERELAEKLNVSRTSVREALKALETLGLIESKHGGGNYIKNNFENILLEPLSIAFLLIGHKNLEVLELRRIIEPKASSLAAKNINDEELIEIKKILDEIKKTSDCKLCAKLDKEFHSAIAKASKNHLLFVIISSLSSLIEEYIEDSDIYKNNKSRINSEHENILKALENHDAENAFLYAEKHLKEPF